MIPDELAARQRNRDIASNAACRGALTGCLIVLILLLGSGILTMALIALKR